MGMKEFRESLRNDEERKLFDELVENRERIVARYPHVPGQLDNFEMDRELRVESMKFFAGIKKLRGEE